MHCVEWDDKYLIGIEQFDDEHKSLVEILGAIYQSFLSHSKKAGSDPQEILDSLTAYTIVHFRNEEDWMRDVGYPQRAQHALEHKAFVARVSEFQRNFSNGSGCLTLDMISYLRVWLLTHISITDRDLGVFLRERDCTDYGVLRTATEQ